MLLRHYRKEEQNLERRKDYRLEKLRENVVQDEGEEEKRMKSYKEIIAEKYAVDIIEITDDSYTLVTR